MAEPIVSVIVPNRDAPTIAATTDSLLSQTCLAEVTEILVVGTDRFGRLAERGKVRWVNTGQPVSAPVARNLGIRLATGKLLAFIDADCVAEPDWLACLLAAYHTGHPVVGGAVRFADRPYKSLCYNITMFHDFLTTAPAGERPNLGTLNLLVDRQVVEAIGPMDERLRRGQDTEWTLRMRRHGYRLHFEPRAVVTHQPQVSSLWDVIRLWLVSGQYNGWIRAQYRDLFPVPPFYDRPRLLILAAPAIGLVVTARLFARHRDLWRYWHTLPIVYATKVAWCIGASRPFRPSEATA